MIKAILFDVDGVLIDSFEANLRFFQDLMNKVGYPPPTRDQFHDIFAMNLVDAIKTLTKSNSEEEIQRIWHTGKNREVNYHTELINIPNELEIALKQLSKDFLLGIVTSRVRENIYEAPSLKELKHYFKIAVGYQDTNNHKPDPDPLLFAAKKLKIKPEECIYIGDTSNDLQAGHAANMKVIIYPNNKNLPADAHAASFTELPTLISSLNKETR
ncbi:MAG: HAD family hydrolase [Candidatus Andersenbacteria bacterium]|nr:HAD family hydrolase [bacterium]MDZ4225708.1 HAD family hydrolase [Candidatus Andersenbacteria bacterium]